MMSLSEYSGLNKDPLSELSLGLDESTLTNHFLSFNFPLPYSMFRVLFGDVNESKLLDFCSKKDSLDRIINHTIVSLSDMKDGRLNRLLHDNITFHRSHEETLSEMKDNMIGIDLFSIRKEG